MRVVALLSLSAALVVVENPVERVVQLISGLQAKVAADGKQEQKVYDKFACWCEDTTARKAAAIDDGKTSIERLSKSLLELNGALGSSTAELAQLAKDIASTKESIAKAEEMRSREHTDFVQNKAALEQAITNLDKAIQVLGKLPQQSRKGFVDSKEGSPMGDAGLVETKVLSVAAGVRQAMHLFAKTNDVQGTDFSSMQHFLLNPAAFVSTKVAPHKGTYNTQSTAIQGILSEMHETFERDLQAAIDEEASKLEAFTALHTTKTKDLALLQSTLVSKNKQHGDNTKQRADDSQEREETQAQLKADEEFFTTTKDSCTAKADEWAGRSRARTEELAGIGKALDILTSDAAKATFDKSHTSLLQVTVAQVTVKDDTRTRAYNILKQTAKQTSSLTLAVLASTVSTTGHFDQVISNIDKMIHTLRAEEKSDVEHKDWCQTEKHSADSKNEALEYSMTELQAKVTRLGNKKSALDAKITKTEQEMDDLELAMKDALDIRNTENAAFKQALQDDMDAVVLLQQATAALAEFYNKPALVQVHKVDPADSAPETFTGSYGGRASENTGIVAILGLIREDVEKEMGQSKQDEAASLAAFDKLRSESTASMRALEDKKTTLQSNVAGTVKAIAETDAVHMDQGNSKDATDDYLAGLGASCDWVERSFETRRTHRKAEIEGLQNAKNVLSGAGAGAGDATGGLLATKAVGSKKQSKRQSVQDALKELDDTESSFEAAFLQRH